MFGEIGLSPTMRHHEVQISYLEENCWSSIILVASIGGKMCHCYPCLSYFNSWLAVFLSPRHLVYHSVPIIEDWIRPKTRDNRSFYVQQCQRIGK